MRVRAPAAMTASDASGVTRLLRRMREGDRTAQDILFQMVYHELHDLARRHRRRWRGNPTLDTTSLLHEAYLKLVRQEQIDVESRAHFFALASRVMRHVLTNYARDQQRLKRGGDYDRVSIDLLDSGRLPAPTKRTSTDAFVVLDEALARLEALSERQSRVVECRFYGEMTIPETATALGVSSATVKRDWATAQAWLYREMKRLQDAQEA